MHLEKRVLVTGGAGFLGSHLCEQLLKRDCDVVCVDNFFTGAKRNIAHLFGRERFEVIRHDVTFSLYVEVDEIYNLACPASPIHYRTTPCRPPRRASTPPSTCSASPSDRSAPTIWLAIHYQ
jgi:UDP-glucuronate decarboxylase